MAIEKYIQHNLMCVTLKYWKKKKKEVVLDLIKNIQFAYQWWYKVKRLGVELYNSTTIEFWNLWNFDLLKKPIVRAWTITILHDI